MRTITAPARAQATMWHFGVTYTSSDDAFGVFALFLSSSDATKFLNSLAPAEKAACEVVELDYKG